MNRVKNLLKMNPIIIKEVRSRMRGPAAFITLLSDLVGGSCTRCCKSSGPIRATRRCSAAARPGPFRSLGLFGFS